MQKRLYIPLLVGLMMSLLTQSIELFALSIFIFLYMPFAWIAWVQKKRLQAFQKQMLLFFPFLSSVLRSGHTLEKAIKQSCKNTRPPLSQEMEIVQKEMQLGHSFEEAISNLLKRMPDPSLTMALAAISVSRKMGASLAEAIDHIAIHIQQQAKLKSEIKALTAQGKMQAWVSSLMPLLLMVGLHLIAPGYISPLFYTNVGKIALLYCIVSMGLGGIWIYHIATKEYL
ncbi:MAG: type II secretion system F family protein [Deltaproteobacteria bacterium]|nr:type II secretion system F family protein [Deltaproteobacteria bacterium]